MTNSAKEKAERAPTGAALIAALQSSPYRKISLEPPRFEMPVRGVKL